MMRSQLARAGLW